jgi:cbb3-type cytochrome oxidase subunit 3
MHELNSPTAVSKRLSVTDSFLLTLALGAYFNNLFRLRIHFLLLLVFTVIFLGLIYFFDQYKKSLLPLFLLSGFLLGAVIISLLLKVDYFKGIHNIYQWCLIYNGDESLYLFRNALAVTAGILLLCSIITYLLHSLKKVKVLTALVLILLLVISAVNEIDIPKITVGIIIFYSLMVLAQVCSRIFYKSSNTVNNSIATVYLAPACIIIALLSVCLPSRPEPIQWKGVKLLIQKAEERGSILMTQFEYFFDRTGKEFTLNLSGYSEDETELGGEIDINKETTLKVSTQNKSTSRGYLIGSIGDTYTGRRWVRSEKSGEFDKADYYYDFFELLTAFAREEEAGGDLSNMIKRRSYDIEYFDIRTRSLFYPLKTFSMDLRKKLKYGETDQGAFLFDKAKGYGTNYEVQYYELNLNNEVLKQMLREGNSSDFTVSLEDLNKTAGEIFDYNALGADLDLLGLRKDLMRRQAEIKRQYTTLPDSLPVRVSSLARELTRGYNNNYDKLKALEAYLNAMPYTTRVEKTPKGKDFVDYFLFEQQKGYCTYFASAFGVLARCVGIPTRYVEGFMVDYENKDGLNTYNVLNSNAHSWVEAYIDGIGWIPFEPTPAFYGARYTAWRDYGKVSDTGYSAAPINIKPSMPPSYQEFNTMEGDVGSHEAERRIHILQGAGVIVIILILFIGIIFIYYGILVRKYNKKFNNASSDIKLSLSMALILHYLEKEGYMLSPQETLLSYAGRIGDKIIYNQINFIYVATVFMRVRYGEHEVKAEELNAVMDFSRQIQNYLKEKLGKRRMFFDRFLFLHFYQ